jgi:hypothetical protein
MVLPGWPSVLAMLLLLLLVAVPKVLVLKLP